MLAVGELTPRFLASRNPLLTIRLFSPIVSVILTILFPFILILLYFAPYAFKKSLGSQNFPVEEEQVKEKIIEILQASGSSQKLHDHDERLIESVISFKDRIVREIMVPRVDIFTLPSHLSILDACAKLPKVGFSRIPVYEDNIDNIKGILLYKDLLYLYAKCHQKQDYSPLNQTIKTLLKQPLYTPETKNISNLLADFKKQKVHLAIIVDEYGGTEGLITIEDILEELVGDISDEHDHTKELFTKHKNSWEVDARMSILDIEDKLQIKIPQSGDYDTIGGYIFYCSGEIPPKGFLLHHNSFDLEVTSSNERCVEKIKITPIK